MNRLSSPLSSLEGHYDVVVVGSGYGGAITAAHLAGCRKPDEADVRVAILERGREIQPGAFPRRFGQVAVSTQVRVRGRRFGSRAGLYDVHGDPRRPRRSA